MGQTRESEWTLRTEVLQQIFFQTRSALTEPFLQQTLVWTFFVSPILTRWRTMQMPSAWTGRVFKRCRASSMVALILIAPMKAMAFLATRTDRIKPESDSSGSSSAVEPTSMRTGHRVFSSENYVSCNYMLDSVERHPGFRDSPMFTLMKVRIQRWHQ